MGSGPAVSFYTWVTGRYAPFYTKVISVSEGEAAHVIDGLLYHGGDVDISVHHTDGGGVSDHVFALCHLLGFRVAPRIPILNQPAGLPQVPYRMALCRCAGRALRAVVESGVTT